MKNRITTIDIETLPGVFDKNPDLLKRIGLSETDLSKSALNGDFGRILST